MDVLYAYWASLDAERLIDFEMILLFAHELILGEPTIAKLLGSIFKFVLVDEFQDTKEIQYAILAAILQAAKGQARAFLVGDPNQAIYGSAWRLRHEQRAILRPLRPGPGREEPVHQLSFLRAYREHAFRTTTSRWWTLPPKAKIELTPASCRSTIRPSIRQWRTRSSG